MTRFIRNASDVHTVTDLMIAATTALEELRLTLINDLIELVENWCQTDEEKNAQLNLLWSIEEAIEDQQDLLKKVHLS